MFEITYYNNNLLLIMVMNEYILTFPYLIMVNIKYQIDIV